MAKVPDGQDAVTWDGKGEVWFKIYAEKAISSGGQLSWASLNKGSVSVTIPKSLPSGDYLLRVEHIALHMASSVGGAQFYISCAQVKVSGGGSGSPSPLVSFPGVYKSSDPGIKVNIYSAVCAVDETMLRKIETDERIIVLIHSSRTSSLGGLR